MLHFVLEKKKTIIIVWCDNVKQRFINKRKIFGQIPTGGKIVADKSYRGVGKSYRGVGKSYRGGKSYPYRGVGKCYRGVGKSYRG